MSAAGVPAVQRSITTSESAIAADIQKIEVLFMVVFLRLHLINQFCWHWLVGIDVAQMRFVFVAFRRLQ